MGDWVINNQQDKEDDGIKEEVGNSFVCYNDLFKGDCNVDWIVWCLNEVCD